MSSAENEMERPPPLAESERSAVTATINSPVEKSRDSSQPSVKLTSSSTESAKSSTNKPSSSVSPTESESPLPEVKSVIFSMPVKKSKIPVPPEVEPMVYPVVKYVHVKDVVWPPPLVPLSTLVNKNKPDDKPNIRPPKEKILEVKKKMPKELDNVALEVLIWKLLVTLK